MSTTDDDDSNDDLELPEPDKPPLVTPGSASWAERTDPESGPPPYEESINQIAEKWRASILAASPEAREVRLEARRKRLARVASRRANRELAASQKRLAERWRGAP